MAGIEKQVETLDNSLAGRISNWVSPPILTRMSNVKRCSVHADEKSDKEKVSYANLTWSHNSFQLK